LDIFFKQTNLLITTILNAMGSFYFIIKHLLIDEYDPMKNKICDLIFEYQKFDIKVVD
jgi:hypothetical protein